MSYTNFFDKYKNDKEFQRYYKEASDEIDIAIALAAGRKRKRLTQAQLAKKVGMPQSQLARIESGNHNVTLKNLARVAGALDLRVRVTA